MKRHWTVPSILLPLGAFLLFFASPAWAGVAAITKASGIVQIQEIGSHNWVVVKNTPVEVSRGDTIRTGFSAQAVLTYEDGSRIELGGNSSVTLEENDGHNMGSLLNIGTLRAYVKKLIARKFQVRTPTAVCSVRGTEFRVEVMGGGRTVVDLYKGLLGVEDHRGQQVLLHPNERLEVDLRGMSNPSSLPSQGQIQKSQFHSVMRREMSLDMSKEEVQSAAAKEIKLAEFQQGKVLIDVFGKRVRLEEYIVRPRADQFKLVVLNERATRFDYFYYLGTFNQALPADLSVALRQLGGGLGTAPAYFLTGFETGRSNTRDSAVEVAQGGHLVDVNNNADPADNVAFFYDAVTDRYVDAVGKSVFQTLFDRYGFYLNGGLKYGWTGNNITSYSLAGGMTQAALADPITGAALAAALPTRSVSVTFPEAELVHQVIYESYTDGTFTKWDNYIIRDDGRIATVSDFKGITTGAQYKQKLLDFNYEQVLTASEFQGRKIDLVVEPRILIQSGLIQ